jgi:hypothetical protein
MNNHALLQTLSEKIHTGEITRDEVMNALSHASIPVKTHGTPFSVTKLLYILGAAIVVIGIIAFVSQIWEDLGSGGKIFITLGLGLLFTALGSALLQYKREDLIGTIFHGIGGLLIPGGAMVTLSELSTGQEALWPVAITFGSIFAFYLLLNAVHNTATLTFFAIANGTAFVYLLVGAILDGSAYENEETYAYLTMAVGASYLLLSHAFQKNWNAKLIGILYFFGSIALLGAAFSRVFDSVPWQMAYFLLILGGLFLSAFLRSSIILAVSIAFLIAHFSYITSEYFADSVGWPLSLIVLGFLLIGLGVYAVRFNKEYIEGRE